MIKYIIHLLWLTIGLTYCNLQAQSQYRKSDISVNLGIEYDLISEDSYLDGWFPRLSIQYKQFEIGGFYYFSNEIQQQKSAATVVLPDLHSDKSKLNVFVKYYPIKNMGFNCELGLSIKEVRIDSYNFMTKFVENPVTTIIEKRNIRQVIELKDDYKGNYLAMGYSHKIIKGLFVDSQLKYNFGEITVDVYVDDKLTDDASDLNQADPSKHNFYIEEIKANTNFWDLTLGLTYKFGLK